MSNRKGSSRKSNRQLLFGRNIIFLLLLPGICFAQQVKVEDEFPAMGTRFGITLTLESTQTDSTDIYLRSAKAEVERIESLISSWDDSSQTAEINRNAGLNRVKVDEELFELVRRGQYISQITSGAFDLTFAGLDKLWKFDGSMKVLPDSTMIAESRKLIDHKKIYLQEIEKTVYLELPGMRIGFGGIGKGYAANKVRNLLKDLGVKGGAIDAGGDLITWGMNDEGEPWKIGIRKPGTDEKPIGFLDVTDMAVVTSGNYERFAMIDGVRYSHIIDPRTGWPVTGLKSVTVVSPDAELADALATAVFVLGKDVGLDLIEQLHGVDCVVIDDADHIFTTKGVALLRE